jgi:hypothetical protein
MLKLLHHIRKIRLASFLKVVLYLTTLDHNFTNGIFSYIKEHPGSSSSKAMASTRNARTAAAT